MFPSCSRNWNWLSLYPLLCIPVRDPTGEAATSKKIPLSNQQGFWSNSTPACSPDLMKGALLCTVQQCRTLTQCWRKVGPASLTLAQLCARIVLTSQLCGGWKKYWFYHGDSVVEMVHKSHLSFVSLHLDETVNVLGLVSDISEAAEKYIT